MRVTAPTSRRGVLAAGATGVALTGLAGCGLVAFTPAPPLVPDPLTPLYDSARALAARCQRIMAAYPGLTARLTPIAQAHTAHADELARIMNPPPGALPTTAPPATTEATPTGDERAALAAHRDAETAAAKDAAAVCRQAPAVRAPIVGSIAAARASHAEALR
jgi:hypothetical protein